jgi:hypothetical protein
MEWIDLGREQPGRADSRGAREPRRERFCRPERLARHQLVNPADGRVELFQPGEERPRRGYCVDIGELDRYCRARGRPLPETNGQMSLAAAA